MTLPILVLTVILCFLTGTVLARILVFPLIVKGQREAAKLNNHMPQITALTTRMNEAKRSGNRFECKSRGRFNILRPGSHGVIVIVSYTLSVQDKSVVDWALFCCTDRACTRKIEQT